MLGILSPKRELPVLCWLRPSPVRGMWLCCNFSHGRQHPPKWWANFYGPSSTVAHFAAWRTYSNFVRQSIILPTRYSTTILAHTLPKSLLACLLSSNLSTRILFVSRFSSFEGVRPLSVLSVASKSNYRASPYLKLIYFHYPEEVSRPKCLGSTTHSLRVHWSGPAYLSA